MRPVWVRIPLGARGRHSGLGVSCAALLGFYLGDGCLSQAPRTVALRVSCDASYPGIIRDIEACIRAVHPGRAIHRVPAPGAVVVQNCWRHWPCLFPQHGPGLKHERPIVLEPWQLDVVADHPWALLRGLFHSDGSRSNNWASRTVDGVTTRYDYPRWQVSNTSEDILGICSAALDLVDVPWRRSNRVTVSVSRRAGVAALDEHLGMTS